MLTRNGSPLTWTVDDVQECISAAVDRGTPRGVPGAATITNDQGTIAQQMSFDAFGLRRDATNWDYDLTTAQITALKDDTDRGFTFQEQLDNVGLIHMNGRMYDPNLGRFLSVDPIFEFPTNTQSLNPYSYVLNNPLSMTDPTGYCGQTTTSTNSGTGETTVTSCQQTTATDLGSHIAQHGDTTTTTTLNSSGRIVSQSASGNGAGMGETAEISAGRGAGNGTQMQQGTGDSIRNSSATPNGQVTSTQAASITNTNANNATNAATGSQTQTGQAAQENNPSQRRIEQYVGQQANAYGLPTKIGIAVVQKESSFNVNAVNKNRNGTTDYGLMMVNSGNFGHKVMGANGELFTIRGSKVKGDWTYNVKVGMSILQSAYGFAQRYAPSDVTAATYARYNAWSEWKFYTKPGTQVYKDVQGFLKTYNGLSNGP